MADTRKDKRAPVSLKVRFKSADISEFIEQYSVDMSNGGMFIQSNSPLEVGTLLKFELQLKDESRIIEGVGRVVWVRGDADATSPKMPPGMGVKFIKMSQQSRSVLQTIVSTRGEGPSSFESSTADVGVDSDSDMRPGLHASAFGGLRAAESSMANTASTTRATMPAVPDHAAGPPRVYSSTPPVQHEEYGDHDDDGPVEHTQVRHASEFLALALAEGASDRETLAEAERRADEARRRTEQIEEQRARASAHGDPDARADDTQRTGARVRTLPFEEQDTTTFSQGDGSSSASAGSPQSGTSGPQARPVLEVLRATSIPPPPSPDASPDPARAAFQQVAPPTLARDSVRWSLLRGAERDPYERSWLDARMMRMLMFALMLVASAWVFVQCTQRSLVRPHDDAPADVAP
jgi:uncharacterized protein (TIGR02266 family)